MERILEEIVRSHSETKHSLKTWWLLSFQMNILGYMKSYIFVITKLTLNHRETLKILG